MDSYGPVAATCGFPFSTGLQRCYLSTVGHMNLYSLDTWATETTGSRTPAWPVSKSFKLRNSTLLYTLLRIIDRFQPLWTLIIINYHWSFRTPSITIRNISSICQVYNLGSTSANTRTSSVWNKIAGPVVACAIVDLQAQMKQAGSIGLWPSIQEVSTRQPQVGIWDYNGLHGFIGLESSSRFGL